MKVQRERSQTEDTYERNDASDLQSLCEIGDTGQDEDYANQHQKKDREHYPRPSLGLPVNSHETVGSDMQSWSSGK